MHLDRRVLSARELDEELLTVHMLQHLLLMTAAPPLLLLGSPVLPLLHGLPKFAMRGALGPLLRFLRCSASATFSRILSLLDHGHGGSDRVACSLGLRAGLASSRGIAWSTRVSSPPDYFLVARDPFLAKRFAPAMVHGPLSFSGYATVRRPLRVSRFLRSLGLSSLSTAPRRFDLSPLQDQQCAGA